MRYFVLHLDYAESQYTTELPGFPLMPEQQCISVELGGQIDIDFFQKSVKRCN